MEFLTPEELLGVLKIARKYSTRDWLMILIGYKHGLRREEICQIRLGDIQHNSLSVERLKGSKRTVQPLTPHRGNPLLDEVRGLKAWLAERPKDSGDALFPSEKGSCMTGRRFAQIFQKYCALAGVSAAKSNPHTLKHSLANHMIRAGQDVAYVQQFLGHSQISSTLKYVSLTDSEASEAAFATFMSLF